MKTTIELPDEIFHKAKLLAAARRTTLKEIMVQALQMFTTSTTGEDDRKRKATLKRLLKAMQSPRIYTSSRCWQQKHWNTV